MTMTGSPCFGLKQNPKATPKLIQSELTSLSLNPFSAAQNIDSLRRCTAMIEKRAGQVMVMPILDRHCEPRDKK